MKFFLDSADVGEIREAASWGILDGVTTNPTHVAKVGRSFKQIVAEICEVVSGPVSAQVTATDFENMVRQGRELASIAPNVVVKVPIIVEGLKAIKAMAEEGIRINTTLCFSAVQSLLAAKAGATYVSPFIGRLDDIGHEGMEGVGQLRAIFSNCQLGTQILVAGVRHPIHVLEAAVVGADVVTLPFEVFEKLIQHPLTDLGLKQFQADWENVPAELRDI